MPDRGSPTLLRILPLGMAAALLLCLFPPLKARRQRQARGQAIIDSASDAIISIDSGQFILHANAAAARLFDDTPAGMRGMRLGQYILRDLHTLGSLGQHGDCKCLQSATRKVSNGRFFHEHSQTPLRT